MRNTLLLAPLVFFLTACEGHYRYPCQDPANWGKIECNNEVCKAEGTCTAAVLAKSGTLEDAEIPSSEENSEALEQTEINNKECVPAAAEVSMYSGKGEEPRKFGVKNYIIQSPKPDTGDVDTEVIDDAAQSEEQPLTMNTVVDTAAHNAATR